MKTLPTPSLVATFLRSFVIQGSWNYRTMLGSGFAFAMLPTLRRLSGGDPAALETSLRRHLEHFNAHPYLSGVALGAAVRMEAEGEDPETIRRFKTAVRGPLGGLGDSLVWGSWLPAVSLLALGCYWMGLPGWSVPVGFLIVYNAGHFALRAWCFQVGLHGGRGVGRSLSAARLGALTEGVRAGGVLLLGLTVGAVLAGRGGLGDAGPFWGSLAILAFLGGSMVGHRLWRPAAAAVVAAVAFLATVGWAT